MKRACSLNTNKDENLTCEFHPATKINYYRMKNINLSPFFLVVAILGLVMIMSVAILFAAGNTSQDDFEVFSLIGTGIWFAGIMLKKRYCSLSNR